MTDESSAIWHKKIEKKLDPIINRVMDANHKQVEFRKWVKRLTWTPTRLSKSPITRIMMMRALVVVGTLARAYRSGCFAGAETRMLLNHDERELLFP